MQRLRSFGFGHPVNRHVIKEDSVCIGTDDFMVRVFWPANCVKTMYKV